jgi:hypothetical protein
LKQEHEFQLKQLQMRSSEQARQGSSFEEGFQQFERELAAKNRELGLKDKQIEELGYQMRDREELFDLLKVK